MSDDPIKDHLDAVYRNQTLVHGIIDEMDKLAYAFLQTGNERVTHQLDLWIKSLGESADKVASTYAKMSSANVRQSMEASNNILRGVLAGIDIGAKE